MTHLIIDASDLIVGRLASYTAKAALLGNKVDIINCEKAVITGKKNFVVQSYKEKYKRGEVFKGPFMSRSPDRFVRRIIRGMLPYKNYRGKMAYKNIMCYIGTPDSLKEKKTINLKTASISKVPNLNYMTVKKLTSLL